MDNANTHNPLGWIGRELKTLDQKGLRRRLFARRGVQGTRIVMDGRELINFGSNDYLGLSSDPRVIEAAIDAIRRAGFGSGASPLVCGRGRAHRELERKLAEFEGTEAALVFPSGYAANAGSIGALAGPGDAVFTDRKNHASLLDGCRLSRADVRVYPHADMDRLAGLLGRAGEYRRRLIASDSLFSMDGDVAPLLELAELARRHDAMLMVDEAHATGVFGEQGRGLAEHLGVEEHVDVRVGTLSKALGSAGGFVAGSQSLIDWLVNRARPYVFSTAGPVAAAAAAAAALEIVRDEPHRRRELLRSAAELRQTLAERGWNVGASVSQIIPVIVGKADRATALSGSLRRHGFFVPAVRPPTVPEGEACLRISLGWEHTPEMVADLVAALGEGG